MTISPRFIRVVQRNLAYWQEVDFATGNNLSFQNQLQNLTRAIQLGLVPSSTKQTAAELALHHFPHMEQTGQWQQWLSVLEAAASQQDYLTRVQCVNLLARLGQLERLKHNLETAIAYHQRALDLAAEGEKVLILWHLAEDYLAAHRLETAAAYADQALEHFSQEGFSLKPGMLYHTLGRINLELGHYSIAKSYLERAFDFWREAEMSIETARILNNLARLHHIEGNYEIALLTYRKADGLLPGLSFITEKITIQLNIGALLYALHRYDDAYKAFNSIDLFYVERAGMQRYQAMIHHGLGDCRLQLSMPSQAIPHLQSAIKLSKSIGDKYLEGNSRGTLAEAYASQGATKKAICQYRSAVVALHQIPNHAIARRLAEKFRKQCKALVRASSQNA